MTPTILETSHTGSISEAVREEETLRYGASLLAESVINDTVVPRPPTTITSSLDDALVALAQLGTLRLNMDRVVVSLFDGRRQHVIAEATRSTPIELGPAHPQSLCPGSLLLSGTAIPRSYGVCEAVLDLPPVKAHGSSLLPIFMVPDLTKHPVLCHKPYVKAGNVLRFYAGVPLRSPQGIDIGVCCICDSQPRSELSPEFQHMLRHIATLVMAHLQTKVLAETYRRSERMVRGLGSLVEGTASMSIRQDMSNVDSFLDIQGKEGTLNAQQQAIQTRAWDHGVPFADIRRPEPLPSVSSPDLASGELDSVPEPDGSDCAAQDAEGSKLRSFTSQSVDKEDEETTLLKAVFSRAANIIRESIEVEGALFLDAAITSFGGLVPATGTEQQDQPYNSLSSGEESAANDEGLHQAKSCKILGFSTSSTSSINGDLASASYSNIPEKFLKRILSRHPDGQVFNFSDDGSVIWAVSDSEESNSDHASSGQIPSRERSRKTGRPRKNDAAFLVELFPGARSVALVPLWDSNNNKWFSGGLVWTRERARVFSVQGEMSYLKAFGSATMAEVARIFTLREGKAKEDVLSSLSHEIRSPLHGVILGVELMHDTSLTVLQEDVLHTIETCGRTLLDTMDHLLDFSKLNHFLRSSKWTPSTEPSRGMGSDAGGNTIEAGMMSLYSDVSVDLLLEEVIESVYAGYSFQQTSNKWTKRERSKQSYFDQANTERRVESVRQLDSGGNQVPSSPGTHTTDANVSVYLSIEPNVSWEVYAQAGAIRRIIMNIFGNALKYTSKGSILVSLTQESPKKKNRRRNVVFTVSDSGQGISNTYLQTRLFQPFAQENQLSSGAGLGLSLVKQIVMGLGGRIGVDSRIGHGTTVRISLPLVASTPGAAPKPLLSIPNAEFTEALKKLEGATVALLGFTDNFGESPPFIAEKSATGLYPKLLMETMCRQGLKLTVLSEAEARTTRPTLYICQQSAMGSMRPPADGSAPAPVLVVCDNILASHQLTVQLTHSPHPMTSECLSQPIGPRKLAKILVLILERELRSQTASHISNTLSPPTPIKSPGAATSPPHGRRPSSQPSPSFEHLPMALNLPSKNFLAPTVASDLGATQYPRLEKGMEATVLEASEILDEDPDTFLLVDDNAINLKILESYMKKLGRRYDTATNGLEALEACRSRSVMYRCIFMDISMPIMDGLESTRHIRAHEKAVDVKSTLIITLTGLASAKIQQEAYASGVDLFLTKPVPLKELGRILQAKGV